jgi:hypothetical protein
MPQPDQFTNSGQSGFVPPRYQPIRPSDVAKVKESYGIKDQPKFSRSSTDKSIYDFSTKTVLDWWKKQQQQQTTSGGGGGGGGGSTPPGGGGGGGSAPTPAPKPPASAPESPKPPIGKLPDPGPPKTMPIQPTVPAPKPVPPVTDTRRRQMLQAAGHPEWNPPAYALVSEAELAAWIQRALINTGSRTQYKAPPVIQPAPKTNISQEPKLAPKPPVQKIGGVQR